MSDEVKIRSLGTFWFGMVIVLNIIALTINLNLKELISEQKRHNALMEEVVIHEKVEKALLLAYPEAK